MRPDSLHVYNGELYNFHDLRPELESRGHLFRTRSDTEVVLHAYEEWGTDCLRKFNGMFAIAIWDQPLARIFLARDRIGDKPLYYYHYGERLVFASEIKAILEHTKPSVPRFRSCCATSKRVAGSKRNRGMAVRLLGGYRLLILAK
jgi:asparagine synthase (glutamine-hydrolysing)